MPCKQRDDACHAISLGLVIYSTRNTPPPPPRQPWAPPRELVSRFFVRADRDSSIAQLVRQKKPDIPLGCELIEANPEAVDYYIKAPEKGKAREFPCCNRRHSQRCIQQ